MSPCGLYYKELTPKTQRGNWTLMMPATMIEMPWLHHRGGGWWTLPPMLDGHKKTMRKWTRGGVPFWEDNRVKGTYIAFISV